jgi:hypothetical protein
MEPYGGAGVLWLPADTPESKAHALETVYVQPQPKRKKRRK